MKNTLKTIQQTKLMGNNQQNIKNSKGSCKDMSNSKSQGNQEFSN